MNLPIVYQPSVVSDDRTMRFMLLVMDVSSKTKKPTLADVDEFWADQEDLDAYRALRRSYPW